MSYFGMGSERMATPITLQQAIERITERRHNIAQANPPDHLDVRIEEIDRALDILREVHL